METVNGCTIVAGTDTILEKPVSFGPAETDGAYVAMMGGLPPGTPGPPLHIHPHTDEAFYVARGEATFLVRDRELKVTSGSLVFVPRGVPHTVSNVGEDPMQGIIIISPGSAEHLFQVVEGS
jgi:mannose-6-phosphate isomerase-like protein (cupin superfamily)